VETTLFKLLKSKVDKYSDHATVIYTWGWLIIAAVVGTLAYSV
jgi:hypothetical protein